MALPEMRLFETALVLAEELHFSRAAERLHIDQSTVSTRLNGLENRLGYQLLKRNHKTVELTEGGRKFIEEDRVALLHAERAVQGGRAASQVLKSFSISGGHPTPIPSLLQLLSPLSCPYFRR